MVNMTILRPFKGIRPQKELAHLVASRPYDVMSSQEAREDVKENPLSFLHVTKSEIDLPEEIDHYDQQVYWKAKANLQDMVNNGVMIKDKEESLYIYSLTMGSHTQSGILACASVDDYMNNIIKKHELTRIDKEQDRINHIRITGAQTGLVFLMYEPVSEIDTIVNHVTRSTPEYDFTTSDNVGHKLWTISDNKLVQALVTLFAKKVSKAYIADGHHRSASAANVCQEKRKESALYSGKEGFNFFISIFYPSNQVKVFDYNRVVKDLNGLENIQLIKKLSEKFDLKELGAVEFKSPGLHVIGMYLDKKWYSMSAKAHAYNPNDPISVLDVSILQNNVLGPILGIKDPRTDKRIDFVGGIRGMGELVKLVDSGAMIAAFAVHPVSVPQIMAIADAGKIMPPKSTWFEPKPRDGLIIHSI